MEFVDVSGNVVKTFATSVDSNGSLRLGQVDLKGGNYAVRAKSRSGNTLNFTATVSNKNKRINADGSKRDPILEEEIVEFDFDKAKNKIDEFQNLAQAVNLENQNSEDKLIQSIIKNTEEQILNSIETTNETNEDALYDRLKIDSQTDSLIALDTISLAKPTLNLISNNSNVSTQKSFENNFENNIENSTQKTQNQQIKNDFVDQLASQTIRQIKQVTENLAEQQSVALSDEVIQQFAKLIDEEIKEKIDNYLTISQGENILFNQYFENVYPYLAMNDTASFLNKISQNANIDSKQIIEDLNKIESFSPNQIEKFIQALTQSSSEEIQSLINQFSNLPLNLIQEQLQKYVQQFVSKAPFVENEIQEISQQILSMPPYQIQQLVDNVISSQVIYTSQQIQESLEKIETDNSKIIENQENSELENYEYIQLAEDLSKKSRLPLVENLNKSILEETASLINSSILSEPENVSSLSKTIFKSILKENFTDEIVNELTSFDNPEKQSSNVFYENIKAINNQFSDIIENAKFSSLNPYEAKIFSPNKSWQTLDSSNDIASILENKSSFESKSNNFPYGRLPDPLLNTQSISQNFSTSNVQVPESQNVTYLDYQKKIPYNLVNSESIQNSDQKNIFVQPKMPLSSIDSGNYEFLTLPSLFNNDYDINNLSNLSPQQSIPSSQFTGENFAFKFNDSIKPINTGALPDSLINDTRELNYPDSINNQATQSNLTIPESQQLPNYTPQATVTSSSNEYINNQQIESIDFKTREISGQAEKVNLLTNEIESLDKQGISAFERLNTKFNNDANKITRDANENQLETNVYESLTDTISQKILSSPKISSNLLFNNQQEQSNAESEFNFKQNPSVTGFSVKNLNNSDEDEENDESKPLIKKIKYLKIGNSVVAELTGLDSLDSYSETTDEDKQKRLNSLEEQIIDNLLKQRQNLNQKFADFENNKASLRLAEDKIQQQLVTIISNQSSDNLQGTSDSIGMNQMVQNFINENKVTIENFKEESIVQAMQSFAEQKEIDEILLRQRIERELKYEFNRMQMNHEEKMRVIYRKMIEFMYLEFLNS